MPAYATFQRGQVSIVVIGVCFISHAYIIKNVASENNSITIARIFPQGKHGY